VTVEEVIAALSKFDPKAPAVIYDPEYGEWHEVVWIGLGHSKYGDQPPAGSVHISGVEPLA